MGLGPPIIALYHQLKTLGLFDDVKSVAELGSQNVWCPQRVMMHDLFRVFGRVAPPPHIIDAFADWKGSSRDLHEHLGMEYACIDVDERFGSLTLDMNFDEVPPENRNRYDLTTNHGTSEHILNQFNVFKMMHDLTRPGGLIMHAQTFTVHLEHGFFNYQPVFFRALARANAYETLGVWVGPDWQLSSLVPCHPSLLEHLSLSAKTTHLLVVLHRKTSAREFRVPLPRSSGSVEDRLVPLYCHTVDGEYYDGARSRLVTTDAARWRFPGQQTEPWKNFAVQVPAEIRTDERSEDRIDLPVGPPVLALYRQLRLLGMLDRVQRVIELGANSVECAQPSLVEDLLRAFGRPAPPEPLAERIAKGGIPTRDLYEVLGIACTSVDPDGGPEAVKLDLNFDPVPVAHRGRYDLATDVGTGSYVLNQLNVFRAMHDFTRPLGLMLHVLPFTVQFDRTFFGYQPNFFDALAKYNSYRTLGVWLGVDAAVPSLIPWQPSLLDYISMSPKSAHMLLVLFQKLYSNEFCVPFQGVYEPMVPARTLARYPMVVDGQTVNAADGMSGKTEPPRQLSNVQPVLGLSSAPGMELLRELVRRAGLRVRSLRAGNFRQAFVKPVIRKRT
jgi:hypothetical protein